MVFLGEKEKALAVWLVQLSQDAFVERGKAVVELLVPSASVCAELV